MYRHPETLSDWILLMQAAKEEYGDLNVKLIAYDMNLEEEEYP